MKPRHILAALLCLSIIPLAGKNTADDAYVRIAKAIEAFGEVFREVQVRYVDHVDPVDLVDVGIDAMLEHLDPYSEYLIGDENEDIQNMTTGSYVGVGIVVDQVDSALIISDLREGGSAREAGVRIGDRIIRVDTASADSLDQDRLRSHTRGVAGTKVTMRLVREGRADTINVVLERRALPLESIYVSELLSSSVGYVKLTRFTSTTRDELLEAINSLQRSGQLSGLILDLRDNPGGLLEAAIDVSELFVPQGSAIVSTRGRAYEESRLYASTTPPQFADLPLAVIINEHSASASEVVAGAIQDLDRGVIIGKRSYGKGFVQSMLPLSAGSSALKLTTARYYTPSGRCIQRVDKRNGDSTATQQFTTLRGRRVSARHGIDPDSVVTDSVLPTMLYNLEQSGAISSFATRYAAPYRSLPSDLADRKTIVDEFVKYLSSAPSSKRDPLFRTLEALQSGLDKVSSSPTARSAMQTLQQQVEREYLLQLRKHAARLREMIAREIQLRFSTGSAQYRSVLLDIPSVRTAYNVLRSPKYGALLAPKLPSDQ
jgi:carboxyl-terminal processing protease